MSVNKDTIFEFKAELTALDYINSRPKKEKKKLIEEIRLIAVSIIQPRLTYEEILSLELSVFNNLLQQYSKKLGKEKREKITGVINKQPGSINKGYNFTKISRMDKMSKMD